MRCFLPTANIDKIGLYATSIKVYFYYFVFYIGQEYFNILKYIPHIEKLAVSQVIIVSKIVMT